MYQVSLASFQGPLDLLLYLVKKHEVEIRDIPLARLADQFLDYVQVVQAIDVEFAGDFVVMAATLMEIKSRSLLPASPAAEDAAEADPRRELVRQLLEYRRFKDAATALEKCAAVAATRLPRADPEAAGPQRQTVRPVELWDLVSAFARLMRETKPVAALMLAEDETPQAVYEAEIRALVAAGPIGFREAFRPPYARLRLIGLFLAILELIRRGSLLLERDDEIRLRAAPVAA